MQFASFVILLIYYIKLNSAQLGSDYDDEDERGENIDKYLVKYMVPLTKLANKNISEAKPETPKVIYTKINPDVPPEDVGSTTEGQPEVTTDDDPFNGNDPHDFFDNGFVRLANGLSEFKNEFLAHFGFIEAKRLSEDENKKVNKWGSFWQPF